MLSYSDNNKLRYSYPDIKTRYEFPGYSGANAQVKRQELNGFNGVTEPVGRFDSATKTYLSAETRYGIATRPVSVGGSDCPELCVDRWIYPY